MIFAALAAMGAGLQVATEAVTGHGDARTAALAVAVPVAGYLLGLALVMIVTGTPPTDERAYPKFGGAVGGAGRRGAGAGGRHGGGRRGRDGRARGVDGGLRR